MQNSQIRNKKKNQRQIPEMNSEAVPHTMLKLSFLSKKSFCSQFNFRAKKFEFQYWKFLVYLNFRA